MYSLNSKQAEGLANFFFDVAKGLVLGGIGFTAVSSPTFKIIAVIYGGLSAIICVES